MRKLTRRATVLTAGLAASTVMGVAFAAWTSNGSGAGSAASTTSEDSAITAVVPLSATNDLFPGAVKETTVNITNDNDYPVIVTAISAGSSDLSEGPNNTVTTDDCAADSVRTDAKSLGTGLTQADGTTVSIPANSSGNYKLVLRMSNTASDGCKSKSFNLPLTADLSSAATTAGNSF